MEIKLKDLLLKIAPEQELAVIKKTIHKYINTADTADTTHIFCGQAEYIKDRDEYDYLSNLNVIKIIAKTGYKSKYAILEVHVREFKA